MSDSRLPVSKGHGFSRRKALKQALLTGAGLAVAVSPLQTADSSSLVTTEKALFTGNVTAVIPNSISTPGTSYKLLTGLDFRPTDSAYTYSSANFFGIYSASGAGYFAARLDLPQQAKITEIEFYVLHNTIGTSTQFYLNNPVPSTSVLNPLINYYYSNTSSSVQTVPLSGLASFPKVDNTVSQYMLVWHPPSASYNETLFGARVGYTGGIGRFGA